jgi:hypothetical protein
MLQSCLNLSRFSRLLDHIYVLTMSVRPSTEFANVVNV